MASQWERLLKNQGTWQGSFTRLSVVTGEMLEDTPTEVSLQPLDEGALMRQEIRRFPTEEAPQLTVLEYRSLNRSVLFFENGAFSQGSMQWSPVAEFGAELGLIHGQERLRLVQLYLRQRTLGQLTLIREHLPDYSPPSRPPLSIEQLVGTWQGEATTLYPDWQPAQTYSTRLVVRQTGGMIEQTLSFGDGPPIQSCGQLDGQRILFDQGEQPVTVLLLADGASASFPTDIVSGQPLFLEAGWLIQPDRRQRLLRSYDARGAWTSLTLLAEQRVA